jgi:hypothetical protein
VELNFCSPIHIHVVIPKLSVMTALSEGCADVVWIYVAQARDWRRVGVQMAMTMEFSDTLLH